MEQQYTIFQNGSTWLRADFHLHTKADSEFNYKGNPNEFVTKYIAQLKTQDIRVGVITNHNKFDLTEFKALRKAAKREEIYLLPGIEFSCKDGAKGMHLLIVFDYSWIDNSENHNYITDFITTAFAGISNYDSPQYPNSKFGLKEAVENLDAYKKDYFIIMAHIDDDNGIFKELKGRNLREFLTSDPFKQKVLGLQKSRSHDNRKKLTEILGKSVPAFVEGSDYAHKGIEGIGNGDKVRDKQQKTYIKLGSYNFDALKFALIDKDYRIASKLPEIKNGYIKSITFQGGKLGSTTIHLNHAMNNLIGIRGSGKSSILESIRYCFDINISKENNLDWDYKTKLVNSTIGSGGKVVMELADDQGNEYRAEKILGESTTIYKDEEIQYGLKTNAIVAKPIYFGQKDLSKIGSSLSTEYLMNNLIGDRIIEQKRLTDNKAQEVYSILSEIKKIDKNIASKPDVEAKKAELQNNIQKFKDFDIDKKLEEQIGFNKDANHIIRMREFEEKVLEDVDELINEYKDGFDTFTRYESKENPQLFIRLYESFQSFLKLFGQIEDIRNKLYAEHKTFKGLDKEFQKKYEALKEKFAEIKREIKLPNIQADDYVKFTKDLDLTKAKLKEIEKLVNKKVTYKNQLKKALTELQQLWHNEFEIIKQEVDRINKDQDSIKIIVDFKGNKNDFKSYLKDNLKGSGLRDTNIQAIIDNYNDLIEVYHDLDKKESKLTESLSSNSQLLSFQEYFNSNLAAFLTYRVPDHFEIIYRNRPLSEHSLGQKASALIIFLLTLKDSHLIIIDQPEDDLDNQTIYDDVIKVLKNLKNETQFIFATHNPNIPVLGDCEQVISCRYKSEKIETNQGSIDQIGIRNDIVDIMEGGEEAFNQRKRIYELWKH
ncbi:MAG: hypothetical protein JRJ57_01245 [Deltaproteobacteria bacterium]|nr:hypothetical protein [Deltaproteobacteria bacterium]